MMFPFKDGSVYTLCHCEGTDVWVCVRVLVCLRIMFQFMWIGLRFCLSFAGLSTAKTMRAGSRVSVELQRFGFDQDVCFHSSLAQVYIQRTESGFLHVKTWSILTFLSAHFCPFSCFFLLESPPPLFLSHYHRHTLTHTPLYFFPPQPLFFLPTSPLVKPSSLINH